ncbi:ABC transporter ATP-binding protein [Paenibacillus sp. N1-5-1-14]|uniref:ABC transporter ATP-binding protein n=1 Tax=Paenibacillus radicibacter TaxID=2972488 RepID=UPI002159B321|nr:ABC transporter ATP-binding protein [Paenibacillus radicibacter]MCR8642811.1 ABC transporter ATP-binding protein [Paenibacillus radicibacter]
MKPVVKVKQLTKSYGDFTAVNQVSFELEANKIYGLLGRNGAGKTTIMQLITAQAFATSGKIEVFGEEPYENTKVLNQMCFIKESQKYPDTFRIMDVLTVAKSLYPNWDEEFAQQLVEEFRLPLKRSVKKLSRGMLSSVGIIVGLACRAPLTIFDEPYLGLDAVARTIFYDRLIDDYTEHPRTIILSTHLIDEVSKILEHVILIDRGQILINADTDTIRGKAFTIVGSTANVQTFTKGMRIIHQESLGGLMSATVLGGIQEIDRKHADSLGLEIAPVKLQELVVHLTSNSNDNTKGVAL